MSKNIQFPNRKSFTLFLIIVLLAGVALIVSPVHAATITVNSTADVIADDGQCTLREAITAANTDTVSGSSPGECPAGSGADIITLPAGTYTLIIEGSSEHLNETGDLDIRSDITINGDGAANTIIQAGSDSSNSTNGNDRVFHVVDSGDALTLNNVTARYGQTSGGGAYNAGTLTINNCVISNNTGWRGAGILNKGILTLNSSVVTNNSGANGAGLYNAETYGYIRMTIQDSIISGNSASLEGGGIYSVYERLGIHNSTISGNSAAGGNGGGIVIYGGFANIHNSTISGNSAAIQGSITHGGGIYQTYGTVTIQNSTISGNSVAGNGGGISINNPSASLSLIHSTITNNAATHGGGGIDQMSSTVRLKNTIVAGNSGGSLPLIADCANSFGATISEGYNLVGAETGCPSSETGDQTTSSPGLGPLQDNGGPTHTHALLLTSPAFDAIPFFVNGCFSDFTSDQRGEMRPSHLGCDVGAFELQIAPNLFTVNSTDDGNDAIPGDGVCVDGSGSCTLRAAISESNALGGVGIITLPAGTYTLTVAGHSEDGNATGDLDITSRITINGAGASTTIIDADQLDRVLHVVARVYVNLNGLTLANGQAPNGNSLHCAGGGVRSIGAPLTIRDSIIRGNTSGANYVGGPGCSGGGVYNAGGLIIENSTIRDNTTAGSTNSSGGPGGGIAADTPQNTLIIRNSTISGNTTGNGSIAGRDGKGGGVYVNGGTATIENSTISGNVAKGHGGGLFSYVASGMVSLDHSTITGNTADADNDYSGASGGGIRWNAGGVTVRNTVIAGNADEGSSGTTDCYSYTGIYTSQGYNLVGSSTGCPSGTDDQTTSDAKLGPLQYNGGPTHTHALLSTSPALDAIPDGTNGCGTETTHDQRGAPRPADGDFDGDALCDIGAYEYDIHTIHVNSTADVITDDGQCTLREAITAANTDTASGSEAGECPAGFGTDTIILPAGIYTLAIPGHSENYNATGDLDIRGSLTINGAGADSTVIDANQIDRVLEVVSGTVELYGLTLTNGQAPGAWETECWGGGVFNTGTLTIRESVVSNNAAGDSSNFRDGCNGGGVQNYLGTLTIEKSTIRGNTAGDTNENRYAGHGGGVSNRYGTVTIRNSTISANTSGWGPYDYHDGHGGGVYAYGGTVTIENSTISGNDAYFQGGGVYAYGTVTLVHSTVTNNTGNADKEQYGNPNGGGVFRAGGTVTSENTIIAGNIDRGYIPYSDCAGQIIFQGYNLLGTDCPSGTNIQITSDAKLGPLGDNGGPTETHALLQDSPALEVIPSGVNGCGTTYTTDQRGETRPADGDLDGLALCDIGAFELQESEVAANNPPVANDDNATTPEDTAATIDVLANDTDADGDTLTVASVTQPSNGSVTNNGTNVSYTPSANYSGSDSFTYSASDGNGGSDTATVTVTVTPVNDPPVAEDDAYSTDEDTTLTVAASGVLGNDTDAENDSLTAVKVGDPSHGTLTLYSDGSFTYTPDDDYNGTDSFTYKANDGAADSNTATVTITINAVNDPPVTVGDAYNTDEDTTLTAAAPGVLGNDSDLDSDPLTAVKVSDPSHGTLTLNSDGSFTYTPDDDYNGSDSFTYKANDGTADSNTATVTITVNPVNDAPTATGSSHTLQADTSQAITLAGEDVETALANLTFTVVDPSHGTLSGTAPNLTYTPAAGFTGDDSFTFTVTDRGDPAGCTGGLPACSAVITSAAATVTIHVEAAVPVLDSISPASAQAGSPDVTLSLTGSGFLSSSQVKWNGTTTTSLVTTYVDTQQLTAVISATLLSSVQTAQVTVFTPEPGGGTSSVLAFFVTEAAAGVIDQEVASGDNPTASSGIVTADATGSGLLVVAEYDANPGGVPSFTASGAYFDVYAAPDSSFSEVSIVACDLNDGDHLYWWDAVSGKWKKASPQTYDPDTGCITVTVTDTSSPSISDLSGTVFGAGNTPPVADDDFYSTDEDTTLDIPDPGVLDNDTDEDGDSLTAVLVSGPSNGSLSLTADGSFTYTPAVNFNGTDSFTYQANDGALDSVATVTITVNPVNDAPVITAISADGQTIDYSDHITLVTITAVDVDSYPLMLTESGLPADLSLSNASCAADDGNGATCNWTLSGQVLVQEGVYEITFTANDGLDSSNTVTHTLTVEAEDAAVTFDEFNEVSVLVLTAGVDESQPFSLTVDIEELEPDLAAYLPGAGIIDQAEVSMSLVPVGPGEPADGDCSVRSVSSIGYDAVLTVKCSFEYIPVNTYLVEVTVDGGYYTGSGEDVLTVYDPSLGFTTGGGWFYWPDDGTPEGCPAGARTNFGYTMKYNKKGTRVKGSLLLICHLEDGTKYRIKSNALEGLALGENDDGENFGWASFSGKATYLAPESAFWNSDLGEYVAQGNYEFTVYVEDHNDPGNGIDRFWIETRDKDNVVATALSMPAPAPDNTAGIEGGNIFVPHGGGN